MDFVKSEWNGYERLDFVFEGRKAIVVLPKEKDPKGRWMFKTEYFGAFPSFELEMLSRGWGLAHLENSTRWVNPGDIEAKKPFCDFLQREFGFAKKCLPVGMSCGGMQGVYFASMYPAYVAALYLDAPVMNRLSCPCGIGLGSKNPKRDKMYLEMVEKTGRTVSDLINDRNQPIDHVGDLIKNRIPVFLVCGDADVVVPYPENGAHLANAYRASEVPFFEILKPGCDHHPHGLDDLTPLVAFAEKYCE
ncbi:MAG: hypothetical protein IJX28_06025 [Clostridia bacterium]|nr:hypothetical protein [Clostridia bacterium]